MRQSCCAGNAPASNYPGEDQYQDEQKKAELCDSGLPDTEVCDVLHIPPRESEVVSEAWSRGYVTSCSICLHSFCGTASHSTCDANIPPFADYQAITVVLHHQQSFEDPHVSFA